MVRASKPLTVYGTHGYWRDERCLDRHKQARFVIAAPSKAAIFRLFPELRHGEWTKPSNELDRATALSKPLALFARHLFNGGRYVADEPYHEVLDFGSSVRR